MRILYLAHRIPFPPDKGDKIRSFHEVEHLAARHDVTVATLIDDPALDRRHVESLRKRVREVLVEEIGPIGSRARTLKALLSGRPLSLGHFSQPRLARAVSTRIESGAFDVALVFSSSMAPYVGVPPRLPAVLDLVDVDSVKWSQVARLSRGPLAALYRLEASRLGAFERRCASLFSRLVVSTEAEAEDLKRVLGGESAPIEVVRNGIDAEAFAFEEPADRPPAVVFTGAMDYVANADAVRHFHDAIWPEVRRQVPEATFTIVGRNPTPAVRALGRSPGVRVTGTVPDVRPFLRHAAVAVAPLRIAQGVQNKILEAIASGLPVVASHAAARGIEADVRATLAVVDEPAGFATAVVAFLRDPARRIEAARVSRHALLDRYNWPLSMSRLEAILHAAVEEGSTSCSPTGRLDNPKGPA